MADLSSPAPIGVLIAPGPTPQQVDCLKRDLDRFSRGVRVFDAGTRPDPISISNDLMVAVAGCNVLMIIGLFGLGPVARGVAVMADLDLRIAKLELAPGDVLVIKSNERLSAEHIRRVGEYLSATLPGIPFLVLDTTLNLSVLRRGEVVGIDGASVGPGEIGFGRRDGKKAG